MTRFSQGDVVPLCYPFTDLQTTKQRPAVIISANWFNQRRADYVLVAITSQVPAMLARDEMALSPDDLTSAGLPKPSIVKLGKIAALEQSLVRKRLGKLPGPTRSRAVRGVCQIIKEEQHSP